MDDDPLMQAIWQRWKEPHDHLNSTKIELQTAEEELKVCKAKVWEKHKEAGNLKHDLKAANQATETLQAALDGAKREISFLASRAEAMEVEIQDVATENITALQARNQALMAGLEERRLKNDETEAHLQTVTSELSIAKERAETAIADMTAARYDLLALEANAEEATSNDNAITLQHESIIAALTTKLSLRNSDVETLQSQLQKEKRAYEGLQRSTQKALLESRSVSTDLLHSYLKDKHSNGHVILPLKLRTHEWILSRIEDSPDQVYQAREPAETDQLSEKDLESISHTPTNDHPATTHAKDRRKLDGQPKITCVCTRCYMLKEDCTGDVQCESCTKMGVKCTYKFCKLGAACHYPHCGYVHPGQEMVDGFRLDVGELRTGRKRKRQR